MNTIAISQFRNNLPRLINEVNSYMKRLVISVSGQPKAVVLSLDEFESLEETAEILAAPAAYRKIKTGEAQAKKKKGVSLKSLKI